MNIHPTKSMVIVMIAAMIAGIAIVLEMPKSFAQNTTTTGQNATMAEPQTNQTIFVNEGNVTTLRLNSTVIPLQTTTIQIVTVTKSIDSQMISQVQNMTVTAGATEPPSLDLSGISNQTLVSPAGQSISTIVTRTDVPFNVTSLQLTSNTAQNQTFMLDLRDSPEQLVQQLFSTPQQMPANQTTQNSTAAP